MLKTLATGFTILLTTAPAFSGTDLLDRFEPVLLEAFTECITDGYSAFSASGESGVFDTDVAVTECVEQTGVWIDIYPAFELEILKIEAGFIVLGLRFDETFRLSR